MAAFIIYMIRWGVVLTLLYSLYGILLKGETLHGFNRIVLLAILIASMILPLCQIETKEPNYVTQGREMIEYQISNVQNPLGDDVKVVTIPIRNDVNAYIVIAIAVYLAGLVIYWVRYIFPLLTLVRLIHQGKHVKLAGLPKHVTIVTHSYIETPCSWMRWIILNPSDVDTRAIINHELAHIRLAHSWDMLLCELTCRMLWCVPFAWMLRQDLRDVHEYQADRRVLSTGIEDKEYQLLLIRKATGTGLQPVVNALNQSPIKRRFKMMYTKPSRRWVALKAAYLLPLSALALVAFARPQAMSEVEQKVEEEVTKYVATAVWDNEEPATAEQEEPIVQPTIVDTKDTVQVLTDANLVNADIKESGYDVLDVPSIKNTIELLDSTMQAVGAKKIADGTYIGHFQPNLNSDTVRIARATILNRQSQQTDEHLFAENVADPYAYNVTLNAETRKDRIGYYIRYLQPVSSTLRNYDKPEVDPNLIGYDKVLMKRNLLDIFDEPIAIEQTKKETRVFKYMIFHSRKDAEELRQSQAKPTNYAIHDVETGDKYMIRSIDYDYFKYVKDEEYGKGTMAVYQVCFVFPPLDKDVKTIWIGDIEMSDTYIQSGFQTYNLKDIPHKPHIITN